MFDPVKVERVLGVHFRNPALCREAFTHKSFAAEHAVKYDNQRLELLGDAVVQIILTEDLFQRYVYLQEGALTKIRSALVNQDSLAAFARDVDLGSFLMLGKGEIELHGDDRDSTISDAFEAFMGAVFLDQGLDAAKAFFMPILLKRFPEPSDAIGGLNPKGALQEFTQHDGVGVPVYRVVGVSGPDHQPEYEVEVTVPDHEPVRAKASSRKLAECAAAKLALDLLKKKSAAPKNA